MYKSEFAILQPLSADWIHAVYWIVSKVHTALKMVLSK